jgi:hypothetical protein
MRLAGAGIPDTALTIRELDPALIDTPHETVHNRPQIEG